MGYLLLSAHLFDVVEDVQHVTKSSRCFLNFWSQADTAHRYRLEIVSNEAFWIEETLKENLSRCHSDLQRDNKSADVIKNSDEEIP